MVRFYKVGGAVRDHFLGLTSKDIDYAVEADSFEAMREAILERGGEVFLETPQYFTIRARVPGLGACDFVLCRKDGSYSDGRRPDSVECGTIYDDLARRDFTVNALAIDEQGGLLDPHNGLTDIRTKTLRTVGKAEDRFTEDGLRLLRALRFAVTKEFVLDVAISDCLYNPEFFEPRLKGVSNERIREELGKMFKHSTPDTIRWFDHFLDFRDYLFSGDIWLKPTLELR